MRDDDNNPRCPSWRETDDVGKFFYVMVGVLVFLILSAIFGE